MAAVVAVAAADDVAGVASGIGALLAPAADAAGADFSFLPGEVGGVSASVDCARSPLAKAGAAEASPFCNHANKSKLDLYSLFVFPDHFLHRQCFLFRFLYLILLY